MASFRVSALTARAPRGLGTRTALHYQRAHWHARTGDAPAAATAHHHDSDVRLTSH